MRLTTLAVCLLITLSGTALASVSRIRIGKVDPQQENFIPDPSTKINYNETEVLLRSLRSHANGSLNEVKNFYLWTRHTPKRETLDPTKPDTITNSTFAARKTFIIIHGFLGFGMEQWILELKDKLLNLTNSNVIVVDWPAGSSVVQYYTVVKRVPYVADDLNLLLEKLGLTKGFRNRDVHVIGHSLGAHIAGLSGKVLGKEKGHKERYGRITGLDPAGLTYHNVPAVQRLDKTDADYVDVMHTNGCYNYWNPWLRCFGINENLGDTDFWPNGGENQPACQGEFKGEIGCDHMMSYKYFLESVDYGIEDTFYLARNCSSWSSYVDGDCPCGDNAQYMGFYANTEVSGVFYLNTSDSSPYARRDAVCSPGKTVTGLGIVTIVASAGSGLFVVIGVVIAIFFVRRSSIGSANSGLMIEGNDDDDPLIGGGDSQCPSVGVDCDDDDSFIFDESFAFPDSGGSHQVRPVVQAQDFVY